MKKIIWVFAILPLWAVAGTNIDSDVASSTTWTKEGSPYIVTSSIHVDPGVTLSIEAGVEIQLNQRQGISIDGELNANGSKDNEIYLHPISETESWKGLSFNPGSKSNLANLNIDHISQGLSFNNAVSSIENLKFSSSTAGLFIYNNSNVKISDSILQNISNGQSVSVFDKAELAMDHSSIKNIENGSALSQQEKDSLVKILEQLLNNFS